MALRPRGGREMNTYEKHIYELIQEWEHEKRGYLVEAANGAVLSAFAYIGSFISASTIDTVAHVVETSLRKCFSGSLYTTSKTQIAQQANKIFDCKDLSDLNDLGLEQLDLLSSSYCTTGEVMAVLEGAGVGFGGFVFMAADIPALMMISMRALIQLAYIYGIDASNPDEREYILHVMTLAAAHSLERADILQHLDAMARSNAQKQLLSRQMQDHLVGEAVTRFVHVAHKIAVRLTHAKLLQMVPILGSAIGAGANYLYVKEIVGYGMMVFRKRWLTQKYNLPPSNLLAPGRANPEQLLTSWVMIGADGDADGDEMEEDFRTDSKLQQSFYKITVDEQTSHKNHVSSV